MPVCVMNLTFWHDLYVIEKTTHFIFLLIDTFNVYGHTIWSTWIFYLFNSSKNKNTTYLWWILNIAVNIQWLCVLSRLHCFYFLHHRWIITSVWTSFLKYRTAVSSTQATAVLFILIHQLILTKNLYIT